MASTTIEELLVQIRLQGAQPTQQQLKAIREEVGKIETGFQQLSTLGGALVLVSNLREMLAVFSEVSGLNIAAQFTGIALSLETVTGSAEKANRLLRELKQLGKETPFDTAELAQFASRMIGAGVATEKVTGELSKLADIAAFGGINRADLAPFLRNLLQIRGRGSGRADMADINELKDRVPAISRILAAGFGGKDTPESALKRAQGLTGRQLYETILKGSEALAKGAAAARALRDPVAALANLFETLKMIMEPTGQILIRVLAPAMKMVQMLANALQNLNERTGGLAGLATLIGGGLWLATRTATAELWGFVRAMLATAGAARSAGGAAAAASAVSGAGGAAASTGVAAFLPRLMAGGLIAGVIAMISGAIGDAIGGDGSNWMRRRLGMAFQPFGGFRVAKDIFDNGFFGNPKKEGGEDPQTRELKQVNRNLEEMKGRTIGAGKRTAAGISNFEAEYAISKAFGLA
jgi:hypothetical protein